MSERFSSLSGERRSSERRAYAERVFQRLCQELGVEAKLEFRAYKKVIALAILPAGIVRVNTRLLDDEERARLLGREEPFQPFMERVLRHELLHVKLKTSYHPPGSFQRLV